VTSALAAIPEVEMLAVVSEVETLAVAQDIGDFGNFKL
jgi:hypothetical protein